MEPAPTLPDLWSGPGRLPVGRILGLTGAVCAVLAAALWWQDEPGRLFLVGPLDTLQMVGLFSALAVIGITGWLFSLAWRLELHGEIVTVVFQLVIIFGIAAVWIIASLWGLLMYGLFADPRVRLDVPEADTTHVVQIFEYEGSASLTLYRGGPFHFERVDLQLPSTGVPREAEEMMRVVEEDSTAYLVYPTSEDGPEARIEIPIS